MKKQFMPLALVSLLVCSLLCTSAFAANRDTQTEPAVIEVDTAALFSTIESNEAQMVNVLEKQAGAVVVAPEFSHFIVTTVEKRYKGHHQRKRQREGFFSKSASAKPRNVR